MLKAPRFHSEAGRCFLLLFPRIQTSRPAVSVRKPEYASRRSPVLPPGRRAERCTLHRTHRPMRPARNKLTAVPCPEQANLVAAFRAEQAKQVAAFRTENTNRPPRPAQDRQAGQCIWRGTSKPGRCVPCGTDKQAAAPCAEQTKKARGQMSAGLFHPFRAS